ncbi:MAG: hypothetical protein EZS28_014385 [Streblomastix strix]|uniref:Uncharacterized protein n=1 Tax=Streblomastix strix TaxID=222440 RepID=A0A5J4W5D7_9EUKA|nr:MAG: hypothetical protein EZS28_014385 [Streblomastix strix]
MSKDEDPRSMAQARFTNFEDQLFQYIYTFKMHEAKNSNTNLGILLSLQTFQRFFQPLKRSDITSIGFLTVLKKIGLYSDPSFYLPSNTTLIVFFILFSFMFFSTVFIGFIMTASQLLNYFLIYKKTLNHSAFHQKKQAIFSRVRAITYIYDKLNVVRPFNQTTDFEAVVEKIFFFHGRQKIASKAERREILVQEKITLPQAYKLKKGGKKPVQTLS